MPSAPLVTNDFIDIGIPIALQTLLRTRMLIQADSGGGKSYLTRKVSESVGAKVQQLIVDPEGDFLSLREKFDFLLVSKGGDIPISIRYAEAIAHKLLKTGVSAILDLYELKPADRRIFVQRFGDALLEAPKELWHPCIIYVDEAQLFAPESKKSESSDTIIGLCTRGRKRGLCPILATQRLSNLDKNAASQCQNKLIGQATMDIDRFRAAEELRWDKKRSHALRELEPGNFYAFGPAISREPVRFKVKPVITTHQDSGMQALTKIPTPKAIAAILEELKTIPQEAEQELNTKQLLQAEVTRLRGELTKLSNATKKAESAVNPASIQPAIDKVVDQARKEVTAHYNGLLRERDERIKILTAATASIEKNLKKIVQELTQLVLPELPKLDARPIPPPPPLPRSVKGAVLSSVPTIVKNRPAAPANGHQVNLPTGEAKILRACAQYPNGLMRDQFSVLTGYKRSARDTYISRLKTKGYVSQENEKITATQEGIDALGKDFKPLPRGADLQEYWLNILPQGERSILELLIEAYPQAISRDQISESTPYKRSARDTYISRMRSKEIILIESGGLLKASNNLFD